MVFKYLSKIGTTIGLICIPIAIKDKFGYPAVIVGSSMEPTLFNNELHWWKRDFVWLTQWYSEPKIGEIFTFSCPSDNTRTHIKRIRNKAGDWVRLKNGKHFQVPDNHFWLLSDNHVNANDSNAYGPVNRGLLKAKAYLIIWPPNRWKKL